MNVDSRVAKWEKRGDMQLEVEEAEGEEEIRMKVMRIGGKGWGREDPFDVHFQLQARTNPSLIKSNPSSPEKIS